MISLNKEAAYIYSCFYIIFSMMYVYQCQICMSTRIQSSKLKLVCKIHQLQLEVFMIDPNEQEKGHCFLPYPSPLCFSENGEIAQNLSTNQTSLTVGGNLNGQWKCLHGTNKQKSSTTVRINESLEGNKSFFVYLEVPKYVKKGQPFLLVCSSNAEPIDRTAVYSIIEGKTSRMENMKIGCKSQLNEKSCSKNNTYEMMYKGSQSSDILTISCEMNVQLAGNLSDCVFVTVVDISGPILSLDTPLPLLDDTLVTFTCTAWSSDSEINLKWECFNGTTTDFRQMNDTTHTFVSELTYRVTLLDHDKTCSCQAHIGSFATSESTILVVKKRESFHIRLLLWTLTTVSILIITIVIFSILLERRTQQRELHRVCSVRAIYYAAPQDANSVNIYDAMESNYNEIDDNQIT